MAMIANSLRLIVVWCFGVQLIVDRPKHAIITNFKLCRIGKVAFGYSGAK